MTATVLWFTGLSGSGKTTIAELVRSELHGMGRRVLVLDGDAVRAGPHRHLGFLPADIRENNMRIAEICRQRLEEFDFILVPVISPFRNARRAARDLIGPSFREVFVSAPLQICQERDPKGLYARAARGEAQHVIGVDPMVPYERPDHPDLVLDSANESPKACAHRLLTSLVA